LAKQRSQVNAQVQQLQRQAKALEKTSGELKQLQANLSALRDQQLGAMRGRLIRFLLDVMRRAQEAGVAPEKISYQVRADEKSQLVHFLATYAVRGSYQQVRQLISLLESSPQFILVERLGLRGDAAAGSLDVGVQLTVATYFADIDKELLRELGIEELDSELEKELQGGAESTGSSTVTPVRASSARARRAVSQPIPEEQVPVEGMGDSEALGSPVEPREQAPGPAQVRRLSTRRRSGTVVRPEMTEPVDEFYTSVGAREVSGGY
jgi:Tfp pilus assembly protein PilO